jgi:hypothetical protein
MTSRAEIPLRVCGSHIMLRRSSKYAHYFNRDGRATLERKVVSPPAPGANRLIVAGSLDFLMHTPHQAVRTLREVQGDVGRNLGRMYNAREQTSHRSSRALALREVS